MTQNIAAAYVDVVSSCIMTGNTTAIINNSRGTNDYSTNCKGLGPLWAMDLCSGMSPSCLVFQPCWIYWIVETNIEAGAVLRIFDNEIHLCYCTMSSISISNAAADCIINKGDGTYSKLLGLLWAIIFCCYIMLVCQSRGTYQVWRTRWTNCPPELWLIRKKKKTLQIKCGLFATGLPKLRKFRLHFLNIARLSHLA